MLQFNTKSLPNINKFQFILVIDKYLYPMNKHLIMLQFTKMIIKMKKKPLFIMKHYTKLSQL